MPPHRELAALDAAAVTDRLTAVHADPARWDALKVWIEGALWLGTFVALGVVGCAIVGMVVGVYVWPHVVVGFGFAELAAIAGAVISITARKTRTGIIEAHRLHARPKVLLAIARFVAGGEDIVALHQLRRRHREVVDDCLAETLGGLTGEGRAAVLRAILALGVPDRWQREARARDPRVRRRALARLGALPPPMGTARLLAALDDDDQEVRFVAARALLTHGDIAAAAACVAATMRRPLLERVLLVDALRAQSQLLRAALFAPALATDDEAQLLAALETIRACGCTLELPGVVALLHAPSPRLQAAALDTVPNLVADPSVDAMVVTALDSPVADVRAAALHAAAHRRLLTAFARIAALLDDLAPDVALAAAEALAALGTPGRSRLDDTILHGEATAQGAALEVRTHQVLSWKEPGA